MIVPERVISAAQRILEQTKKDKKTGCVIWQGNEVQDGYGILGTTITGTNSEYTHRLMFWYYNGFLPSRKKGQYVMSTCGNKKCCNPDHLYCGSIFDIVNKKYAASRGVVMDEETVLGIRKEYSNTKYSIKEIGKRYGVSSSTVSHIGRGNTYKHIKTGRSHIRTRRKSVHTIKPERQILTSKQVDEVRKLYKTRQEDGKLISKRMLSGMYGVSVRYISRALK